MFLKVLLIERAPSQPAGKKSATSTFTTSLATDRSGAGLKMTHFPGASAGLGNW